MGVFDLWLIGSRCIRTQNSVLLMFASVPPELPDRRTGESVLFFDMTATAVVTSRRTIMGSSLIEA